MRFWAIRLCNAVQCVTLSRMTPTQLTALLSEHNLSGRWLARRLNVSPMWVSRRQRGESSITSEDEARIRAALNLFGEKLARATRKP